MATIEVLVALAIFVSALTTVVFVFDRAVKASLTEVNTLKAGYLAEEALEVVRLLRDGGWDTNLSLIAKGVPQYISIVGGTWQISTTPTPYIDGVFERYITFSTIYRDANSDIAGSGTVDPNALSATALVAWRGRTATSTTQVTIYITNLFSN